MTSKITAEKAASEFDQIIDRVGNDNDRFLVERDGEPAVLIISVVDYLREIAPSPIWLKDIHAASVRNGTDKLTMADIEEEIAAARIKRHEKHPSPRD